MKKIIILLVVFGLGVALYALQADIKRDQYLRALAKEIKAKNYKEAENYFTKIDTLVNEDIVNLPSSYNYFKAKTYLQNNKIEKAYLNAEKYIENQGNKGKFYKQSLDILIYTEDKYNVILRERMKKKHDMQRLINQRKREVQWLKIETQKFTNETVFDAKTNLQWQDDNDASSKVFDYYNAVSYCKNLTLASHSDWLLPSYNELLSIVDYAKSNPAIQSGFKNVAPNGYWSSSQDVFGRSFAWRVSFDTGYTGSFIKSSKRYVRCVRGK